MNLRAAIIPVVIAFVLAGCAPQAPVPAPAPDSSPSLSPSASVPAAPPSALPTEAPLALPGDCDALVSLDTVHSEFSPNFEPIAIDPDFGNPVAQSFMARGGLTCLWGIPQSDAGFTVFVAERATSTDDEQVALWNAQGYVDCAPFLDACYSEEGSDEFGEWRLIHALAGGLELYVEGAAGSFDPLLGVARAAATSMGYF